MATMRAATDLLYVDPQLGPLQDNGGPTWTMALLPGSAAVGTGDPTDAPEFDQRGPGFARVVDGKIDIGAFEVQVSGPSTPIAGGTAASLLGWCGPGRSTPVPGC